MITACKGLHSPLKSESSPVEVITASSPPFSTREPDRYQASRLITTAEWPANNSESAADTHTVSSFIARDGERRREEYEYQRREKIIYIENPSGHFILLPSSKIYSDLKEAVNDVSANDPSEEADVSTDRLLNETRQEMIYHRIGSDNLNGQATTKYRVTVQNSHETTVGREMLIWVDETLGMPIRSEILDERAQRVAKITTELKDIRLNVAQDFFQIPKDYRKVEAGLILGRIRGKEQSQMAAAKK